MVPGMGVVMTRAHGMITIFSTKHSFKWHVLCIINYSFFKSKDLSSRLDFETLLFSMTSTTMTFVVIVWFFTNYVNLVVSNVVLLTWPIDPKASHIHISLIYLYFNKLLATRGFLRWGMELATRTPKVKSIKEINI